MASFVCVHLQLAFKVTRFSALRRLCLIVTSLFLLAADGELTLLQVLVKARSLLSLGLSNASERSRQLSNTIVLVLIMFRFSNFISDPWAIAFSV